MPLLLGGAFVSMMAFDCLFLVTTERGGFESAQIGLMGLSFLLLGLEFILDPARVVRVTRHGMDGVTSPVPLGRGLAVIGAAMIAIALIRTIVTAAS